MHQVFRAVLFVANAGAFIAILVGNWQDRSEILRHWPNWLVFLVIAAGLVGNIVWIHETFVALAIEALHEAWPCSDFDSRFRGK